MKKLFTAVMLVVVFGVIFGGTAQASMLKKIAEIAKGYAECAATHEGGHYVASLVVSGDKLGWSTNGYMPYWNNGVFSKKANPETITYNIWKNVKGTWQVVGTGSYISYKNVATEEEKNIARVTSLGGFVAQGIADELLLKQGNKLHTDTSLKTYFFCNVAYASLYQSNGFASRKGGGDINDLKETSGSNPEKIQAGLFIKAGFDLYRYYAHIEKGSWLIPDVKLSRGGVRIEFAKNF